ncbi:MAG: hypothetical protein WDN06_00990 [Asticcacaulis sp.]
MRKPHLILAAGLYLAAAGFCGTATAQQAYDSHYDDDDRDAPPASPPPTGADAGYDYLRHEYYRYDGPAPQAPAAREQRGYRDGPRRARAAHLLLQRRAGGLCRRAPPLWLFVWLRLRLWRPPSPLCRPLCRRRPRYPGTTAVSLTITARGAIPTTISATAAGSTGEDEQR